MDDSVVHLEKGPWFPMDMRPGQRRIVRNMVLAAKNGEESVVVEILKSGEVDINSKYKWETALIVAARSNNISLCKTLISYGADVNVSRVMQQTALWMAANHGHLQMMEVIISTRKCSQENLDNALRRCVTMNFLHGCDILLRAGADIEATDSMGFASLHVAAGNTEESDSPKPDHWKIHNPESYKLHHCTSFDTCELLLMWQADPNVLDTSNGTPLHYACEAGNEDVCRLLIDNGAYVNAIGSALTRTPLHTSVAKDCPRLVKLFLQDPRIQPNLVDHEGDTPLMSAIQLHRKECVRIFLDDDRWADYMRVFERTERDGINTPMRELIRHMPDMACLVMNKCIELSSHKDPKHPDFMARFNFAFMDDTYSCTSWQMPETAYTTSTFTNGTARSNLHEHLPAESTPGSTLDTRYHGKRNEIISVALNPPPTELSGPFRRKATVIDPDTQHAARRAKQEHIAPQCDPRCFTCSDHMHCKLNKEAKAYTTNTRVMMANHPLYIACQEKCHSVLCHPLSIALINNKWHKAGRYSFYGRLFIYLLFVILLTAQVLLVHHNVELLRNATIDFDNNNTNEDAVQAIALPVDIISTILIVICAFAIIENFISLVKEFPSSLFQFAHWVDLAIYVSTIFLVLHSLILERKLERQDLAAITVLAAWFNILLTLRQFPVIGIFFIMFTRILKKTIIVVLVFFPLLLGFSFTFTLLMGNLSQFEYSRTIQTVLVMLSGEVEYVDTTDKIAKSEELAIVLFALFIILMVIGLLNLLVGLAVSDVETLHNESQAEMLSLRAEKVISFEFYLTRFPRRRAACGCLKYKPNKPKGLKLRDRIKATFNVFTFNYSQMSAAYLLKTLRKPEKTETQYDSLRKEINSLKSHLENANILSPRIAKGDSVLSEKFEMPGARVLKKTNAITETPQNSTKEVIA